jgi:hypothetical protein
MYSLSAMSTISASKIFSPPTTPSLLRLIRPFTLPAPSRPPRNLRILKTLHPRELAALVSYSTSADNIKAAVLHMAFFRKLSESLGFKSPEPGSASSLPDPSAASSLPAPSSTSVLIWSQTWYSRQNQSITDDVVGSSVLPALHSLSRSLLCVSLSHNSLGDDGAVSLSVALGNCLLLKRIDVSDNFIGSRGAIALSKIFGSCVSISEVVLSHNPVGDAGGIALATAFAQCSVPAVELLLMSRCDLSSSSIREFAAAIRVQSKMTSLDFSRNNIDSTGANCICESLKTHFNIQHLDLSHNVIGDAGIVAVSQCLSSSNFSIKCIGLENNGVTTWGAVQFLSLLHSRKGLEYVSLGQLDPCRTLQSVVSTETWQRTGLPAPPDEVRDWIPGLAFIREALLSGSQAVRRMRFMLIGHGLAGKTRLAGALRNYPANTHPDIDVQNRTIGIEVFNRNSLRLDAPGGGIDVELWDFAGQEVSYLSHTQYFSARRCLYLLVWSPFQPPQLHGVDAAPALSFASVDYIAMSLASWMEMLFLHVPDAQFVLCGTHAAAAKQISEADYTALVAAVHAQVKQKMKDLEALGQAELKELKKRQRDLQTKLQKLASGLPSNAAVDDVEEVASWTRLSKDNRIARAFRTVATDAAKHAALLHSIHARIAAIQDHSTDPPTHKKLLLLGCACVDSSDGSGISELRDVLVQHCDGMPVLSESIPRAWVVAESYFADMRAKLGNVISRDDAVSFLNNAMNDLLKPWEAIEFWGYLGRVFIYESSLGSAQQWWIVPDMIFLLDLIRPLIHWDPLLILTSNSELCVASALELHSDDNSAAEELLAELKRNSVLNRRLLQYLAKWNSLQPVQQDAMLDFFHKCHLICALDDSPVPLCVSFQARAGSFLVTARVRDMPARLSAPVPSTSDLSIYHAQFCLPLLHVSFLVRFQSHILARKTSINLCVQVQQDFVFVRRSTCHTDRFYCCIQCLSSTNFSIVQRHFTDESKSHDEYQHTIYVHSDDLGLFQFATQVIEETLATLFSGLRYKSYMLAERDKVTGLGIWSQLGHQSAPSFSELSKKNWFEEFSPGKSLHSLFPHKRCPIFISHTWSDGTEEFVRVLRAQLQQESLAAVCLDSAFFDQSACAVQNAFQSGLCQAGVVIVCLTPRYVTRPNCLKELQWALDLSAKKRLSVIFLPLHPALTYDGIKSMLKHKVVFVSAKDESSCRLAPLSELAAALLNRYLLEHLGAKKWPEMKAWLSDGTAMLPFGELDDALLASEVRLLVSKPVLRDFLATECCAVENEALCIDLTEELQELRSVAEMSKEDLLYDHLLCFSPAMYPEESAARFFWSFSEVLQIYSSWFWQDVHVSVKLRVTDNTKTNGDMSFEVLCESDELMLLPSDSSPCEHPSSNREVVISAILLPKGTRIKKIRVADASKRELWLRVLKQLPIYESRVAKVQPATQALVKAGQDVACDLYISTCRLSSVSAGRNMQLYLNAIMDSLVHVIASDKDHANITFQIGNILKESSSGSAASAKTRIFLLTDNIALALLGILRRCQCDGCQEIYDHIDVVSAQNGRIAAATRFVFLHSANSAPMQAFEKSTIQDVSFAGRHISDCIPRETYSEGSALDTNVHRIIEAHRRMQHEILQQRQTLASASKSHILMSFAYAGDGTGEFRRRIKHILQEQLLCEVWDGEKMFRDSNSSFMDSAKCGMLNASAVVVLLSPLYLTRPNCLRELKWAMDMCAADKTKKLCVLPMHPCVSFAGCRSIVGLAAAGCAAQVILPVDDRCKEAPTQLKQLKAHKLSDVAVQLLQRLTGPENVGINAEWLKLQPWRSDAEGENWEETSQPWAGPCEGKCVELKQLMKDLCADLQAAVVSARPVPSLSLFTDVDYRLLQSQPLSQDFLSLSDTALLRSAFPQLLLNFAEDEAVQLMLLGLRDSDAVGCIVHGVEKSSKVSPSQLNPVDAVFRMAAHMSACFSASRSLASMPPPVSPDADDLVLGLRAIKISDDPAILADMSAKLRRDGIFAMEDLQGLSLEELKDSVAALGLKAVPLRRLFAAVSKSHTSVCMQVMGLAFNGPAVAQWLPGRYYGVFDAKVCCVHVCDAWGLGVQGGDGECGGA